MIPDPRTEPALPSLLAPVCAQRALTWQVGQHLEVKSCAIVLNWATPPNLNTFRAQCLVPRVSFPLGSTLLSDILDLHLQGVTVE